MKAERAPVLAKMKADIKLCGFKTSDFMGILLTGAKRGASAKKDPSAPKRAYTKNAKQIKKALKSAFFMSVCYCLKLEHPHSDT